MYEYVSHAQAWLDFENNKIGVEEEFLINSCIHVITMDIMDTGNPSYIMIKKRKIINERNN